MTTIHSRERVVVSRADTSAPTRIKSKHRGFTYSYTHMKLVALYSTSSTYAHTIAHMISLYAELAGVDGTTVTSTSIPLHMGVYVVQCARAPQPRAAARSPGACLRRARRRRRRRRRRRQRDDHARW